MIEKRGREEESYYVCERKKRGTIVESKEVEQDCFKVVRRRHEGGTNR